MSIFGTLAAEQPAGIRTCLLDEREQNLSRHRDAGLIVVPGSRRQTQQSGQLGSAVIPKNLVTNLSQTAGKSRSGIESEHRRFLASHCLRSLFPRTLLIRMNPAIRHDWPVASFCQ